jgi:hypothetical protein
MSSYRLWGTLGSLRTRSRSFRSKWAMKKSGLALPNTTAAVVGSNMSDPARSNNSVTISMVIRFTGGLSKST